MKSLSPVWLSATPWTAAYQAPLSMGFSSQEYWSGLPFHPPGNLLDTGMWLASPSSPALAGRFFTTESPRKPIIEESGFLKKGQGDSLYVLTIKNNRYSLREYLENMSGLYPLQLLQGDLIVLRRENLIAIQWTILEYLLHCRHSPNLRKVTVYCVSDTWLTSTILLPLTNNWYENFIFSSFSYNVWDQAAYREWGHWFVHVSSTTILKDSIR